LPNEPLLRIEAPLWQAQLVETYLLNTLNYQTLIATRAARIRDVAGPEAKLLEFGTRRAFSPQGSIWAARAALAGGLDSTSNVLGALQLGRQPTGTMAHALVMAISAIEGSEMDAFTASHRYFPGATLLIDTYDTVAAARQLQAQQAAGQVSVAGVRLDSGDLVELSQQVREILPEAAIFASGDLDEYEIARLRQAGACIDGYGLGTRLVTGTPVNGVYKLVEIDGIPVMKTATSKISYPGRKQIFRHYEGDRVVKDYLGLVDENHNHQSQPLLRLVMQNGRLTVPLDSLEDTSRRTAESVVGLPPEVRQVSHPDQMPVEPTAALADLTAATRQEVAKTH
jgi:nicotinate phosphoribosyltransferase